MLGSAGVMIGRVSPNEHSLKSPVCSCVSMTLPDVNGMSFTTVRAMEIDVHTPFGILITLPALS